MKANPSPTRGRGMRMPAPPERPGPSLANTTDPRKQAYAEYAAFVRKLEHETDDRVRIEPCFSPVWDTAIVTICLHESGLDPHHPALSKAVEWMGRLRSCSCTAELPMP